MAHYAQVIDGTVTQVIVAEQEFIDSGLVGDPATWIQTSYNTHGGVHSAGHDPLRKNYAGIGFTYNSGLDAFIPPKPFASWLLNENTCLWDAPVAMPDDGKTYGWDETTTSWIETAELESPAP